MLVIHRDAHLSPQPTVHLGGGDDVLGSLLAGAIQRAAQRKGRCRLGLSGGALIDAAGRQLLRHLDASLKPQLIATWTDEALLPANPQHVGDFAAYSPEHNLRAAYDAWLAELDLPPQQVLPLTLGHDFATECVRFGRAFAQQFEGELDVALLQVSETGAVAGLLPDHPGLEVDDLCLVVHDAPGPAPVRLTLSLPTLNHSGVVVVAAHGKATGRMLAEVWAGRAPGLPVARVHGRDLHWVLSDSAAKGFLATAALFDTP